MGQASPAGWGSKLAAWSNASLATCPAAWASCWFAHPSTLLAHLTGPPIPAHLQCVPTNYNGCDTLDELSCCKGLDLPPDVCTPNGKGSGVCLAS